LVFVCVDVKRVWLVEALLPEPGIPIQLQVPECCGG